MSALMLAMRQSGREEHVPVLVGRGAQCRGSRSGAAPCTSAQAHSRYTEGRHLSGLEQTMDHISMQLRGIDAQDSMVSDEEQALSV